MKSKLLKKARKRFIITHMPQGYVSGCGEHHNCNLFKLTDKNASHWSSPDCAQVKQKGEQYTSKVFDTEQECLDYLKRCIINILRSEGHKQRKDNLIQSKIKVVWYKK